MGMHNAIKYEKTGNICIKKDKTEKYLILQVFFSIRTLGQIFCSRGRPVEQFYWTSSRFQGTSNRNSTGRPVEIFFAFLDEISNSKTFEANLQNSSGRPVESYWTSSRIQRTSNRSSTGRPLEQKIWAIMSEI